MDFIPNVNIWYVLGPIIAVAVIALGFILATAFIKDKAKASKWVNTVGLIMIASMFIISAIMIVFGVNNRAERVETIAAQISQTYGIDLPKDSITTKYKSEEIVANNLNYPQSEPDTDFVRYGTLVNSKVEDGVMIEQKITLAWNNGELQLFGMEENEEVGPELPRVDENQE